MVNNHDKWLSFGRLQMEKTVEINEGRRFMEDLEMLRATGAEGDQIPTFMEEMSPKFSQDMLGSFKMEGNSNPLEQLGLYMKMDEDEDEDDEEDQLYSNQGEVDEQSLDRKETQTLSPHGVEGDDQLVTRNEERVSEGNPEDEEPINQNAGEIQMENVPLSPHVEEGFVSGNEEREEPVSQKAQDNDGKEALENVAEKENGIVDKGEQETEVVNMGEEEAKVVDKGEEEAEVVVDKGEAKPEVVDNGEQETVVVEMGEEETEVVDKGEEETDIVDMGERANEMEQETEVVDKKDEETEVLEKGEKETEVVEKGERATEVVEDETD